MRGTGGEDLDIRFTTVNDVSREDVRHARETIARALTHPPRPVLYVRARLNRLPDPAVSRPNLVSIRVDLNGRPVNAFASGTTMREAVGVAAARLRARVGHLAGYREARRRAPRPAPGGVRLPAGGARRDESRELHDA